ncbi:tetratricopeptide repeat protein [Prosthecobacter sp.]
MTLRTEDGLHSLSCPVGTVLDVGKDAECEIALEGAGVLPHHCMLRRMGERHFRVTAVAPSASFTVNDVSASDLGVDVPFKFGIGGETIEIDLAADEGAPSADLVEQGAANGADGAEAAPGPSSARPSRRDYLLQPAPLKPRLGGRVGEVLIEASPAAMSATSPPLVIPESARLQNQQNAEAGASRPEVDDEESSSLLFVGLMVCAVMIAGIFWWQRRLDEAVPSPSTQIVRARPAVPVLRPVITSAEIIPACRALRLAGISMTAAHWLMPLAEEGRTEAALELARALHDAGQFGAEVVFLLRQAAEGGARQAWTELVREVDHEENPERYAESSFKLLQRAAALGESSAWMPLGERHEHGNGTAPDIRLAREAYEKALACGDERAQAKLSAEEGALQRAVAFVRSWNEVSVATLLDHISATPGRFFRLEYPQVDALLRMEEELRTRWPLRRVSVVPGARADIETFDIIKVTQPFHFEVEHGSRLARGDGTLVCTVQRDVAGVWRVTDAADTIDIAELLPAREKFVSATSLRELQAALTPEERMEESRLQLVREMRGIEETQDFKTVLTVVINAVHEFPQETYWRPFADTLCDRMARQLFADGRWIDPAWSQQVHELAEAGSVSAMLLEGHLLAAGYACRRDEARSTATYQKAFEAGRRRDARFYYAEALFQGRGVPQDIPKAGALVLSFMARSKHPLEAYLAAHLLWKKAEIDPALWQDVYDTLSRVADKHSPAKHLAAMVLLNHGNTTRERKTGFAALKACAESGVQEAMKNLSKCYQDGTGCEADLQAAALWKQKAAITEPPRRRHYTEFEE